MFRENLKLELKNQKRLLRQDMLAKRQSLSESFRINSEFKVHEQCKKLCQSYLKQGELLASYRHMPGELNLDSFNFTYKYKFIFPKVVGDSLHFFECNTENDFIAGSFNIPEPKDHCLEINIEECSMVLVPGVAFDRRGRRLGMGKGFYDKALADYKGLKVGVAFNCQLLNDELPHEDHDLFMDFVITENFTISPIHEKRSF